MLLRNFWNTLKRYKVASLLNILGLSFAFAAFIVIMMQVRYDLTYDKFHSNHENIFRIDTRLLNEDGTFMEAFDYNLGGLPRPTIFEVTKFHSAIEAVSRISMNTHTSELSIKTNLETEGHPFIEEMLFISPSTLDIFDFDIIMGNKELFSDPNKILISQTQAEKLFPGENPIGKNIYIKENANVFINNTFIREVVGVYRDFPTNSYFKNTIYTPIDYFDQYSLYNEYAFIQISDPKKAAEIEQSIQENIDRLTDRKTIVRLLSLYEMHYAGETSSDVERLSHVQTYLFLGIAILIILIAVINFINFSTSLIPVRLKSINTQKVLGQSNSRIRINMIFEAVGICLISILIACWIVYFFSTTSYASLFSAKLSYSDNIPVLLGAFGMAVICGILAGIYPAFLITSYQPAMVLKGSFGLSPQGIRLRKMLVGFQYVVSFGLIIVALFMNKQYYFMLNHPMGYERENVLTFSVSREIAQKNEVFLNSLNENHEINSVGFSFDPIFGYRYQSKTRPYGEERVEFAVHTITTGLIETLGIQVIESNYGELGLFPPEDICMISERLQKNYNMKVGTLFDQKEIAGVFKDINFRPLQDGETLPFMFYLTTPDYLKTVYVKVTNEKSIPAVMEHIRQSLDKIDPDYKNYTIQTLDEAMEVHYTKERSQSSLITLFCMLAICISLIGVFGLILFEIQYRRKEIGIRKINGATVGEVLAMLNLGFIKILVICFIIASPIAYYAIVRWLEGFAYKAAISVWIFTVAFLIVSLITILTVTLQSWKAATEDPINAIKSE